MKSIIQLALKDLKIISREKAALFFLIGMPVMMGLFFGFIYLGFGSKSKPGSISVVVVDLDQSEMSAKLIENLEKQDMLAITRMDSTAEATELIRDKKAVAVVEIPKGFGETAGIMWANEPARLRIGKDPSQAVVSAMLEGFLMEAVGQLIPARMQDVDSIRAMVNQQKADLSADGDVPPTTKLLLGTMLDSMVHFFDDLKKVQQNPDIDAENDAPSFQFAKIESFDAFEKNPNSTIAKVRTGWDISFPAAILWGVMACSAGFAISIVRERTRGTLLRLQAAPLSTAQLILGKGLACYLAIVAVVVMMIGLGIALGMRPNQPLMLAVSTLCIAFCFVGIMMAMSTIGKSEEAVGGSGWVANMVMGMFGGGMIPLAFMPSFMKNLSNLSPVAWAILSLEGAIWRGFDFQKFIVPWLVLIAIGSAGFGFGVIMFRRESRK